jgi:hypothetical protein
MTFPATLPGAALAGKAATGLALAALAVGGAGAVTLAATASAGHANVSTTVTSTAAPSKPANGDNGSSTAFGQQVKAQVATCKSDLQSGQHGIGSCVSSWVTAHNPSNTRPGADASTTGATTAATHRNR